MQYSVSNKHQWNAKVFPLLTVFFLLQKSELLSTHSNDDLFTCEENIVIFICKVIRFSQENLALYFIGVCIKEFIFGLFIGAALKNLKYGLGLH